MKKSELINKLSNRFELSQHDATHIVETLFEIMIRNLLAGDRVEIREFGIFTTKTTKSRVSRNPRTGKSIVIGDRRSICFRSSRKLHTLLNTPHSNA
ncbi:MAG: integration host factor subunit beta [Proteobacteria bacterium]|nr:integration host factor subunit beta [Pseudomonadota bacterium]